jgi:hypothetical protein
MSLFDLLSNIGGTLGLYGGLSFLTLGQFIEVFFYMFGCCAPNYEDEETEIEDARAESWKFNKTAALRQRFSVGALPPKM